MRRHETDWLALSLGGLFLVVAAVHIGTDGTGSDGDGLRWFIPATLLVLGVLGLVGATTRGRTPAVAPGPGYPSPAAPAAAPDDVEHTSRLDDELTLRLDDDGPPEEQPGKPAADD